MSRQSRSLFFYGVIAIAATSPAFSIAAGSPAEALRRDFVMPDNRAAKFRQPDSYFPHRVAMPGDTVMQLPDAETNGPFDVTYEWEGKTYSI